MVSDLISRSSNKNKTDITQVFMLLIEGKMKLSHLLSLKGL